MKKKRIELDVEPDPESIKISEKIYLIGGTLK
jgi:hypothetical protein